MRVRMLWDDKNSDDICCEPWHHTSKNDDQKPEQAQKHWVDIKIFSQTTADAGKDLVFVASIESFFHTN